jgi:hypothetical protein
MGSFGLPAARLLRPQLLRRSLLSRRTENLGGCHPILGLLTRSSLLALPNISLGITHITVKLISTVLAFYTSVGAASSGLLAAWCGRVDHIGYAGVNGLQILCEL